MLGAFLLGFRKSSKLSQNEGILTNGVGRELTPEIIKIVIMEFCKIFREIRMELKQPSHELVITQIF